MHNVPGAMENRHQNSNTDTFTWSSLSEALENLRSFPGDDGIYPEDGKREVGKVEGSLVERCLQKQGNDTRIPLVPVKIWACACRGHQEIGISSSEL